MQAYFKSQAKSWRFQALPHWQDGIEDSLGLFAKGKAAAFPKSLAQVQIVPLDECEYIVADVPALSPVSARAPASLSHIVVKHVHISKLYECSN